MLTSTILLYHHPFITTVQADTKLAGAVLSTLLAE